MQKKTAQTLQEAKQALRIAETTLENSQQRERQLQDILVNKCRETAHEIRTPLNAILSYTEIMTGEIMGPFNNPVYKGQADIIHQASQHLLNICDRMTHGIKTTHQDGLPAQSVDATVLIGNVIGLFQNLADERQLKLSSNIDDDFPELMTDPVRLNQIIINLVSNAIKYTDKGGSVEINATQDPETGATILVIQDNGQGMTQSDAIKALKPFTKTESISPHGDGGEGVGLSIVTRLAEELNIDLTFSTKKGTGTVFSLGFPNHNAKKNEPPPSDDDFIPYR